MARDSEGESHVQVGSLGTRLGGWGHRFSFIYGGAGGRNQVVEHAGAVTPIRTCTIVRAVWNAKCDKIRTHWSDTQTCPSLHKIVAILKS